MEAPDRPVDILIHPGAPPDAGIVFTSTDQAGGRGPLFQRVLEHTGWKARLSHKALEDAGFASQRMHDERLLIAVVTVNGDMPTEAALSRGLREALDSIASALMGQTIWIPLMGTGAGGLKMEESARTISGTIRDFIESGAPLPERITIAPPEDVPDIVVDTITRHFSKELDAVATVRMEGASPGSKVAGPRSVESEAGDTLPESNFDRTPFQYDRAAQIDMLNRRAVAGTMATLIDEIWPSNKGSGQEYDAASFMIHLHGRWGSGKTSILNFLKEELNGGEVAKQSPPCDPPWLIVDYDAWRNQDLGPAWWTLMNTVHRAARAKLPTGSRAYWSVRLKHFFWQLKFGWLPKAGVAILTLIALMVIYKQPQYNELLGTFLDTLKYAAAFIPLLVTIFLSGFVNSRVATQYIELAQDPLGRLTTRYEHMIREIDRPVVVVIDDIDRCNAPFVVDLLQTVQTLFRDARVLYIVAGDRDWICSSYEKVYEDFTETVGEPGRSLGHLFLEKMFQLSIEVPPLLPHQQADFWGALIEEKPDVTQEEVLEIEEGIEEEVAKLDTETKLQAYMENQRTDPQRAAIAGAKVFKRMQSPELKREREHFLRQYADLLEPNPRAMKRLLNAYGFRRGYDIQAPTPSDPDALARWTILANRWPILTDYLSGAPAGAKEPQEVRTLLDDPDVKRVAGKHDPEKLWRVLAA